MSSPTPRKPNKTFVGRMTDPLKELVRFFTVGRADQVTNVDSFGHEGNTPGALTPGGGGDGSTGDQPNVGTGDVFPLVNTHPDLADMPDTGGTNADHDVRYLNLSGLNGLQSFIDFTQGAAPAHTEARLFYDNIEKALAFYINESAVTLQIGYEQWVRALNNSGVTVGDGKISRIDGASGGLPTVSMAKADSALTTDQLIGVATHDIANAAIGIVTTFGAVRGIDTSSCSDGEELYLSATSAGQFTPIQPVFPNFSIRIGICQVSDASDGIIHVNIIGRNEDILENGWNGGFVEKLDFTVTESGGVVTGNLERDGGGDLTMNFSDGKFVILDCTPPDTITLTVGSAGVLQQNFVYIPISTKVLTLSLTNWPSEEHIKVSDVQLRSAALTASEGAMVNHNLNDGIAEVDGLGHMMAVGERIRKEPARYQRPGIDFTLTIATGPTPDDLTIDTTAGTVYQLHLHTFPALDMASGDVIHIVNDPVDPYDSILNLNSLTTDALGNSLTNKSFSFVLWGVQNRDGEPAQLMLNLPTGSYQRSKPADALSDALNFAVYDIPEEFEGTGFLIARFILTLDAPGNSWTEFAAQNLRGFTPNTSAGGGGGGTGVTEWLQLSDTPNSFSGEALSIPQVNAGETALEFIGKPILADGTRPFELGSDADGDVWVRSSGIFARLPIGATGEMLTVNTAAIPKIEWTVPFTSPLTTDGDIMLYNSGDQRLGIGTTGHVLTANNASTPKMDWVSPTYTMEFDPFDSKATVTTLVLGTDTLKGKTVPTEMGGMDLVSVTASLYVKGGAGFTPTLIQVRRSRAGTDADMLTAGGRVSIAAGTYSASSTTVSGNDDIAAGDMIFVEVDQISDGIPTEIGLSVTLEFRIP